MEDNKLIAEFMGLNPMEMSTTCGCCGKTLRVGSDIRYTKDYNPYCNNGECSDGINTIRECTIEECWFDGDGNAIDKDSLKYHESWDWLMPVVAKIENYLADNMGRVGYFDDCLSSNDLEARYQSVVEFIKFYNTKKKGE